MQTYLTIQEVMKRSDLKYGQVIRRIKSKKLLAEKIGWQWLILETNYKKFIKSTSNENHRVS